MELTSAFLDMERRLDIAQHAVETAIALQPHSSLADEWTGARDRAYEATTQYLSLTAPDTTLIGRPASVGEVTRSIDTARTGLDAFYDRHRRTLDSAAGAAAATKAHAEAALAAASAALQRVADLDPELAGYPSVQTARSRVETAYREVQAALNGGDIVATAETARQLSDGATALTHAVSAAPERAERSRRTLASVQTRLSATAHRADTIGATFSILLKEFHADSSADLATNERRSRIHIAAAQALVVRAAKALDDRRPEDTATLAGQAREELATAEQLVDTVTARLAALRALRADPTRQERDVRFRLRDAQRLAVDRDAVGEWGTVLDAQVERIDRIVAELSGRHPDYWQYHLALEEVSRFVTTIINRIRHRSATS